MNYLTNKKIKENKRKISSPTFEKEKVFIAATVQQFKKYPKKMFLLSKCLCAVLFS